MLPKELPPASTVQRHFDGWRDSGLWRAIRNHPVMAAREPEGREAKDVIPRLTRAPPRVRK